MEKWSTTKLVKYIPVVLLALLACFPVVGLVQVVATTRTTAVLPTATRGAGTAEPRFPPGLAGPGNSALPADRQAFLDRQATGIAAAPQDPPVTKGPPAAILAADVPPTPEAGIRDVQISPFRAQDALIANRWQGTVAGTLVVVYAGRLTTSPDQGLVAVSIGTPGTPAFSLQQYPTPAKAGSVRIIAENDSLLTLVSDNGTSFIFDVSTRMFVQGIPTRLPLPTQQLPPMRP